MVVVQNIKSKDKKTFGRVYVHASSHVFEVSFLAGVLE